MFSANENKLHMLFKILLFITMLLSFYFFVDKVLLTSNKHDKVYNTWQFPLLLAAYLDVLYVNPQ
jgi:hypothetical protein